MYKYVLLIKEAVKIYASKKHGDKRVAVCLGKVGGARRKLEDTNMELKSKH